MGFQKVINQQPAPAVAGDWAGANPRASVPSPAAGFRAYSSGLALGLFAWFNPDTGIARNASANGGILGFAHREQKAMLTTFLQEAGSVIPGGYGVDGVASGDVWVDVGAGGIDVGDPVYANDTTGAAQKSASGATLTRWVAATSVPVPAVTDSDTTIDGSDTTPGDEIYTGVMHVASALVSGVLAVGQLLDWSGKSANTTVKLVAQLPTASGDDSTWLTTWQGLKVEATTVTGTAGTLAKISTYI